MMEYAIELAADGETIAALYRSDVREPPRGAIPVSDEIGETLRRTSNFGDWRLIDGRLVARSPMPPGPASVTMRQARLALLQRGLLDRVNATIAALPGDTGAAARIEWEFSDKVERDRPLLKALAQALGLDQEQVDDLLRLAATL